jgi:hypothetical protein
MMMMIIANKQKGREQGKGYIPQVFDDLFIQSDTRMKINYFLLQVLDAVRDQNLVLMP